MTFVRGGVSVEICLGIAVRPKRGVRRRRRDDVVRRRLGAGLVPKAASERHDGVRSTIRRGLSDTESTGLIPGPDGGCGNVIRSTVVAHVTNAPP